MAKEKPTHVVTKDFRDKDNFDLIHEVGKDASGFEPARLAELIGKGLVEEVIDQKAIDDAQKAEAKRLADEAKKAEAEAKKAEADKKKADELAAAEAAKAALDAQNQQQA